MGQVHTCCVDLLALLTGEVEGEDVSRALGTNRAVQNTARESRGLPGWAVRKQEMAGIIQEAAQVARLEATSLRSRGDQKKKRKKNVILPLH